MTIIDYLLFTLAVIASALFLPEWLLFLLGWVLIPTGAAIILDTIYHK